MRIKIVYGNHWNFGIHIADTLLLVQKLFELSGFRADIERNLIPGHVNVVLEGFTDEFTEEAKQVLGQPGTQLIIIATEYITDNTFNDFNGDRDESHYSNTDYWRDRFRNFLTLEKEALAVWHLGESEVSPYRRTLGHERVYYLPHYWAAGMGRVSHLNDDEKDIDFLFTGTETDYRLSILNQLRSKGYNVAHVRALTASFHREDLLARAKIALNIRQNEQWLHPSPSRFHYHLINRSLLITEECSYRADIQGHILTAPEGQFGEFCEQQLHTGDYTRRADEALQAFSEQHALHSIAQELVDKTLSR